MNRAGLFATFAVLCACGSPPRTIALDHRVEKSCDVTLTNDGTSTTAIAGATVSIDIDTDRAIPTISSTCALSRMECDLDFSEDATESILVVEGSSATMLEVVCPADRWP